MSLRNGFILFVVVFAYAPQSICAEVPTSDSVDSNRGSRTEKLSALGKLYGELRGLNETLLSDMKRVADAKDIDGVKAIFQRKETVYETRFEMLMQLAIAAPDSELARDAALLTLNTTYGQERDIAIDLLLEHHISSPRMCEAVTCLGYTSKSTDICRRVLEKNFHPGVVAHAKFQLAYDTWQQSDEDREKAKEELWELIKTAEGIDFHEAGRWGPNPKRRNLSQIAAIVLQKIGANETVKLGEPLADFQGLDLSGNPIALSDYRGKVTLIAFWATWCGPCMKMTDLERHLVERYQDTPFAILGVCGDDKIDEGVQQAVASHRMIWRSVHDVLPDGERLSEKFGAPSWPFCILIDKQGIVRETKFPSGITNDPESQRRYFQGAIEKLLPEHAQTGK